MILLSALLIFSCSSPAGPYTVEEDGPLLASTGSAISTTKAPVCQNTCPSYALGWALDCPPGSRCITFTNLCSTPTALSYSIGCNGDGTPGAPQCTCTPTPALPAKTGRIVWILTDGNYTSCTPWQPACLTEGLAVMANPTTASCTGGTRVEFTTGNLADPYGHADYYDIDIEKGYTVPVSVAPALTCATDHQNHDCRPLWCGSSTCPDAYSTPTSGGCPDGRSPQSGCQDTFSNPTGFNVTFCPTTGTTSCQDAQPCP